MTRAEAIAPLYNPLGWLAVLGFIACLWAGQVLS
jgi:hypothetical protein